MHAQNDINCMELLTEIIWKYIVHDLNKSFSTEWLSCLIIYNG